MTFTIFLWAPSFGLPHVLRSASDVKYTLKVSVVSLFLCRVFLGYILGQYFGLGAIGVWIAMSVDWIVRGAFFGYRFMSGKWLKYTLHDTDMKEGEIKNEVA